MKESKKHETEKGSRKSDINFDIDFNLKFLIKDLNTKITEPTMLKKIKNLLKEADRDISVFQLDINNPKKGKDWIDLETKYIKRRKK